MDGSPRHHIVTRYARAVLKGEIVAGHLVKLACSRHLRDLRHGHKRGLWFDCEAADRVFKFYRLCVHSKGPLAGHPIELEAWQAFCIGSVFGWKRVVDGKPVRRFSGVTVMEGRPSVRRFTEVYEEVARKNGKTTKLAPIQLYTAGIEGESRAENYCAATKRDQARILFDEASSIVTRSVLLSQLFEAQKSVILQPATGSEIRALSKDAHSMDGLNPYFTAVDELHAHKTRDVVDVLESAMGARQNQLIWYITTAGAANQTHSICWEKRSYAVKVLQGVIENDRVFAFIACIDKKSDGAPKDDDWRDPSVWIKANPNLGVSVTMEALQHDFSKAEANPASQAEFRRKRCNEWVGALSAWIPVTIWRKNTGGFDWDAVEGRAPVGAMDLSSTIDITAWSLCWEPAYPGDKWRFLNRYFVPEERIAQRVKEDRLPYDVWKRKGWLNTTPGDIVDYEAVRQQVLADHREFGVSTFAYDAWNAQHLVNQLTEEGLDPVQFIQGIRSYAYPSKYFEALVNGGHVETEANDVTEWMVTSASLKRDVNDNFMPSKGAAEQSRSKIDGLMTMLMSLGLVLREKDEGTDLDDLLNRSMIMG
ncbi:terminase large subunit [Oceanicaulis sp.]|uniref:terminase large subunit n=1 Tax=Oceanicaulis sp. TaxID=1924941 RepID=UPI003F724F66